MADNVIVRVPEQQFIRGEDGFDPVVTIEDIEHGHRVTITDREHPVEGQSFDVMDGASAYEQAVAGGYEGTEEEFNADLADFSEKEQTATSAAAAAAQSEQNAADSATTATTKAQEAAESAATALTRMNSANSSAQAAADSATSADNSANAAASSASAANDSVASASASESNAANSATNAAASETAAAASESAAAASATAAGNSATAAAQSASAIGEYEHDAEAWAIGKRGGTDVESTDETYHNNSKYYAEQAATGASTASSAASAASQSEQNAAASASTAAQSATDAAASKNTAVESASTAGGHAANAASSATAASGSATAAASSATAAGNAQTAAETAQGKAEDAQEAAETAQGAAETAAQSVSQSAAQISQNASDISDLKSALTSNSGDKSIFIQSDSSQLIKAPANVINAYISATKVLSGSNFRSVYVSADPSTVYTVSRNNLKGSKFNIGETENEPSNNVDVLAVHTDDTKVNSFSQFVTFTTQASCHYIIVYFYNANADTTATVDELLSYIKIEKGSQATRNLSEKQFDENVCVNPNDAKMTKTKTVYLSAEVMNGIVQYSDGWTDNGDGSYTHQANKSNTILFDCSGVVANEIYLIEMDTTYTDGEFVKVRMGGSGNASLVYNGYSHLLFFLRSQGSGGFYVTPLEDKKDLVYTISNITVKRVQPSGTEKVVESNSVLSEGHENNLGFRNVLLGKNMSIANGSTRSIVIGYNIFEALISGHRNIAIGTYCGARIPSGENNIIIGADAMEFVSTPSNNCIAIGQWAMEYAENPDMEIAIGQNALYNVKGANNTGIGKFAGFNTSNGHDNTFLGYYAGYRNRTGNGNVCIGSTAYGGNGGNNNTNVGFYSYNEPNVENSTCIGANTKATASNQVVIGNANVSDVIIAGKRITFNQDGSVTWEALS